MQFSLISFSSTAFGLLAKLVLSFLISDPNHTDGSQMFLQLESKHFKMNVPFLLVLIYLLCLNPETPRTIFFFLIIFQCGVST